MARSSPPGWAFPAQKFVWRDGRRAFSGTSGGAGGGARPAEGTKGGRRGHVRAHTKEARSTLHRHVSVCAPVLSEESDGRCRGLASAPPRSSGVLRVGKKRVCCSSRHGVGLGCSGLVREQGGAAEQVEQLPGA